MKERGIERERERGVNFGINISLTDVDSIQGCSTGYLYIFYIIVMYIEHRHLTSVANLRRDVIYYRMCIKTLIRTRCF